MISPQSSWECISSSWLERIKPQQITVLAPEAWREDLGRTPVPRSSSTAGCGGRNVAERSVLFQQMFGFQRKLKCGVRKQAPVETRPRRTVRTPPRDEIEPSSQPLSQRTHMRQEPEPDKQGLYQTLPAAGNCGKCMTVVEMTPWVIRDRRSAWGWLELEMSIFHSEW